MRLTYSACSASVPVRITVTTGSLLFDFSAGETVSFESVILSVTSFSSAVVCKRIPKSLSSKLPVIIVVQYVE
jgi:hypothetical protein